MELYVEYFVEIVRKTVEKTGKLLNTKIKLEVESNPHYSLELLLLALLNLALIYIHTDLNKIFLRYWHIPGCLTYYKRKFPNCEISETSTLKAAGDVKDCYKSIKSEWPRPPNWVNITPEKYMDIVYGNEENDELFQERSLTRLCKCAVLGNRRKDIDLPKKYCTGKNQSKA